MKRLPLIALGIGLMSVATPAAAAQPAFDCRYARVFTEMLLCGNEDLANLDQLNSRIWYEVKTMLGRDAQPFYNRLGREWIEARNNCGWDIGCVSNRYSEHYEQLCSLVNWNAPACNEVGEGAQ